MNENDLFMWTCFTLTPNFVLISIGSAVMWGIYKGSFLSSGELTKTNKGNKKSFNIYIKVTYTPVLFLNIVAITPHIRIAVLVPN